MTIREHNKLMRSDDPNQGCIEIEKVSTGETPDKDMFVFLIRSVSLKIKYKSMPFSRASFTDVLDEKYHLSVRFYKPSDLE